MRRCNLKHIDRRTRALRWASLYWFFFSMFIEGLPITFTTASRDGRSRHHAYYRSQRKCLWYIQGRDCQTLDLFWIYCFFQYLHETKMICYVWFNFSFYKVSFIVEWIHKVKFIVESPIIFCACYFTQAKFSF